MFDFAGLHEAVGVTHLVNDGNIFVIVVSVVQVEIIGLETLERCCECSFDVFGAETRTRWQSTDLGRDDDFVAVAASDQPFTDDLLGLATFVAFGPYRLQICGIDEVPAGFHEGIQHSKGCITV
jgi:hypothetical protein